MSWREVDDNAAILALLNSHHQPRHDIEIVGMDEFVARMQHREHQFHKAPEIAMCHRDQVGLCHAQSYR